MPVSPRRATPKCAAALLCALLLTAASGAGAASAVGPKTDDGYRGPPVPETFEDTQWWYDALRIRQAHRESTGEGVTVAVIDDTIDPSVPELRGQDVRPRTNCVGTRVHVGGFPHADHGTGMVSLVAGSGRGDAAGGRGIAGVAPEARVLFYGADMHFGVEGMDCFEGEIATTVDAAVGDGADIISMSIGLADLPPIHRAIRRALDAGVVVVTGAANPHYEGDNTAPSIYPGVVGVSAVDEYAQLDRGTVRDESADVAAPGVYVGQGAVRPSGSWSSLAWGTGTSPATAITAGALALVKSKYPQATANQLIQHLIHTPRGDGYDWQPGYGFGIVNVTKMLATSPTQWPDENPLAVDPAQTLKQYPMSVSSRVADPQERGDEDPAAPAAPSSRGRTRQEGQAAAAATSDGMMPGWAWPLAVAAALGAVGAVVAATRKARGSKGTDRTNTQGV